MKNIVLLGLSVAVMSAQTSGGELRFALHAEPKTLHPLKASDEPSEIIRYLTSGTLLRFNRITQTLDSELATSWKTLDQGKTLRFELRTGIAFSDGTPFTAGDVCATFALMMDPATASPLADGFRKLNDAVRCRTEGDRLVFLHFPSPSPGIERLLDSVAMLSAKSPLKERAVLGPFVISQTQPGSHVTLVRNPRYWKKDSRGQQLPYLDSIRMDIQRNRDLELARFRRGELHLIHNLDPELMERLRREMPLTAKDLGGSLDTEQMWFNQVAAAPIAAHRKAWFRSRVFRTAVSAAIRRDDLVRVVYLGHALPAFGPISPANQFWAHPPKPPVASGDVLKALQSDGFRLDNGVLRDRENNPVEFSLITNAGNKSREKMAAMIQQDLAAIGMKVTVVPLDFPSLLDRMMKTFQYDACLLGLINTDVDPSSQMNVYLSSALNHQWNPSQKTPETPWEAEIDKLMQLQGTATNPAARKKAFDRVQQIMVEQAPFIYLVHRNAMLAISPSVAGAVPSPLRPQAIWNVEHIYLKNPAQASR